MLPIMLYKEEGRMGGHYATSDVREKGRAAVTNDVIYVGAGAPLCHR